MSSGTWNLNSINPSTWSMSISQQSYLLRLNGRFSGEPALASSPRTWILLPLVLEKNLWQCVAQVSLRAACPSRHPTNSVKALKETLSYHPNHWPGLILSSSTSGLLLREECQLSSDISQYWLIQYTLARQQKCYKNKKTEVGNTRLPMLNTVRWAPIHWVYLLI